MDDFEKVRKLIALKRYETPGDAYFERFVDEFHDRQRAAMLRLPVHRLFLDRLDTWLSGWGGKQWIAGSIAGACAAVIALAIFSGGNSEVAPDFQGELAVEEFDSNSLLREF
tara:strand:+ start:10285 stop:10620 length:336 start_codon:yes stop_codon:yes gene_type:complete